PRVVGRTVNLGGVQRTIVGVMPEGFAFPVSHSLWIPLRTSALTFERRAGPQVQIFGRLAAGASPEQAQAEVAGLGANLAASFPDTHEFIRPQVVSYPKMIYNIPSDVWRMVTAGGLSVNLAPLALLLLIVGNITLLLFARAATREADLLVR